MTRAARRGTMRRTMCNRYLPTIREKLIGLGFTLQDETDWERARWAEEEADHEGHRRDGDRVP
ncbi:MAG TPA: hypothetical protein PKC20_04345, partial [Burkholderiaceae bacterium]|nr:hypothetical protein [Burkholderiaceae bacterium]